MLGPYWIPKREELIHRIMKDAIDNAMLLGYDIVIDNMNLNPKHWKYIQSRIHDFNHDCSIAFSEKQYILEFKDFFDASLEECIERDSKRENPIGEKVITETYNRYKDLIKELKLNQ